MQEGGRRKFLESRYALRELEGAVGRDCRRLEDGRKAEFKHTWLWRRLRYNFLERRDMIHALQASVAIRAAICANSRMDASASVEVAEERRMTLVMTLFPYLDFEPPEPESYDRYFAILDEMEKGEGPSAEVGSEGPK